MDTTTATTTELRLFWIHYGSRTKVWCARIDGIDPVYGFGRSFLRPARVERSGSGRTGYDIFVVGPGLYEVEDRDGREFLLVWEQEGELRQKPVSAERAKRLAQLLGGMSFDEARRASKETAAAR